MEIRKISTGNETVHVVESDGYENKRRRYATKGEALGIGIPALALGAIAFARQGGFGNGLFGGGCNNNTVAANEITAKEAYMKECADAVALTSAIYEGRITDLQEKFAIRQNDVQEKFGLYQSQVNADFELYKSGRDADDALALRISQLESKAAVNEATKPLEYALINCKIENVAKQSAFDLAWRTCRMVEGEVVLPSTPTVTGFPSQRCCPGTTTATV